MQYIPLSDGWLVYWPGFITRPQAFYAYALRTFAWQQRQITLFGRRYWQPRWLAYYGEKPYRYSGDQLLASDYPWRLAVLLAALNQRLDASFNSVLVYYYRDQNDSMGWHADNERQLGTDPCLLSISLGAARELRFRRNDRQQQFRLLLESGSLLMMGGALQQHWQHAILKQRQAVEGRINLTFRQLLHQ